MYTRVVLSGVLAVALLLPVSLGAPLSVAQWERGAKGSRQISLTFDAGADDEGFQQLLQALASANVRCTFFVTGRWAEKHPEYVRQLAGRGHEIGNHSWSHTDLTTLSNSAIASEITRTNALFSILLKGKLVRLFRAPFGSSNARVQAVVASMGFQPVYWSLDSLDSVGERKSTHFLFKRIALRRDADLDGAIVLMHVGESSTAAVMPDLIQTLQARGFRFVTVSQMIGQPEN